MSGEDDHDDDRLTLAEASLFLATLGVRLKPGTLAKLIAGQTR